MKSTRANSKTGTMAKLAVLFSLALLLDCGAAGRARAAVGLSTRFVDVTLEYLQVGVAYNLRELKKVPYTIKNLSGAPVNIRAEVTIPKAAEVEKGYEAIPDPSWVKVVPNNFKLDPGQTGYAQVVIQVPNDPRYVGKNYHAKIWATTVDNPYLVAAGVISNLKFSTGPGPETMRRRKVQEAMETLDFDITPQALYIEGVEPGVPFDFKKAKARPLKISNRSDTELRLGLVSVPWQDQFNLENYQKADPQWLVFKSTTLSVGSDTIEPVYPLLEIPKDDANYGRKFAFLVKAELILGVELEYYNRIYVTTKAKDQK